MSGAGGWRGRHRELRADETQPRPDGRVAAGLDVPVRKETAAAAAPQGKASCLSALKAEARTGQEQQRRQQRGRGGAVGQQGKSSALLVAGSWNRVDQCDAIGTGYSTRVLKAGLGTYSVPTTARCSFVKSGRLTAPCTAPGSGVSTPRSTSAWTRAVACRPVENTAHRDVALLELGRRADVQRQHPRLVAGLAVGESSVI